MRLADAYKDAEIEVAELKIELRDLRLSIGKKEAAIEEALEEYELAGDADRMVGILREAVRLP